MNIVLTTPQIPTPDFPYNIYVVEQARALQRQGHRVLLLRVWQRADGGLGYLFEESVEGYHKIQTLQVGYPVIRGAGYLPCLIAAIRALLRIGHCFKPDIIHSHVTLPVGFAAVMAGKLLGLPVMVTEHWGPVGDLIENRLGAWAMRFAIRHADQVVAVSDYLKSEMISELRITRHIAVIPNLFDRSKFYPTPLNGDTEGTLDVLFVGRGGDLRKGNRLVLEAFASALPLSAMPLRLVMAGRGLEEELLPLAERLGVHQNCVFTGALPIERLADLMRHCGFLVVASRYETFSLVLIEAMACGKPVIATRCGGPEELVTPETGMLVPVDDTEAMADAMVEMSRSLVRYDAQAIARYARESYGEDVVARRLTRMYSEVINRNQS